MNEMDLKTKIEGLEKAITEHKDFAATYETTLKATQQELEDYNKPELSKHMMEQIESAIEKVVMKYDFTEAENYEIDYEIDYNNTIKASNIEFNYCDDLAERISDSVMDLFKEKIEDENN